MANNRYGYNPGYDPDFWANISHNEIYDYSQNTMPFPVDADEIPVQRRYYNQVPQFFHNEGHYNDYRDYDRNQRSDRGNYVPEQTPFSMDTEELYQIEVSIQLSSTQDVNNMINGLYHHALQCSRSGNVLTVTGTPRNPRNGETEFLNLVRGYDSNARLARRR